MNKTINLLLLSILTIALILLSGCIPQEQPTSTGTYKEMIFSPTEDITAKTFRTEEEYINFAKSHIGSTSFGGSYTNALGVVRTDVMMETADSISGGMEKSALSVQEFSETNNQVTGVDEADIIKTDGDYIYTISGNVLYIIKAYPGEEAEIIFTKEFDDSPTSLFINGDTMTVFGNMYNLDFFKDIDFRPSAGMTYFNIYDISDRSNPILEKEYKFEGNYFNARMIDDYVYFVTRSSPQFRTNYPTPIIFEGTEARSMPAKNIYYYNIPYRNPQLATIHAINMKDSGEDINSVAVAVESSQNMYMSQNNIFITYTEIINEYDLMKIIMKELMEPYLTDSDKELIEKIKSTDNDILSQYEKDEKIFRVYETYINYLTEDEQADMQETAEELLKKKLEEYKHLEYTIINKISTDKNKISVESNGKVPGHVINQFSMDEKDNILRIATTISPRWSSIDYSRTESTNNIYALDKNINVIGNLEGLAETESIYSTRFIDDRLYMVTFRQVDPFFVIDLSDPTDIKELGKLKIPGFSRYLHPYDDNTIIGIGQDATATGRTKGLKISLFDVEDVQNPTEVAKYVTEERYASSTALYEHKAFLFSKDKDLLVIPAYSYEYSRDGTSKGYNGAFVFKISKDEIILRGLIDHSMGSSNNRYYYAPQVERSLYIENLLYTKSPNLLRINNLEDLSSVKNITLEQKNGNIPIY